MGNLRAIAANDTGQVDLLYHPYQQAFLDARRLRLADGSRAYRRFGLFSGRRGGKSLIGGLSALEEATFPNTHGWATAPTYPELHDYVLPAVLGITPRGWIHDWSAANHELILTNKSKLTFRSLDDPERGRGPGLDWLWLDEGRKTQEMAYKVLRPTLSDRQGIAWVTTSPNGWDWCYHRFYKPALDGRPGFWATKYRTIDNPKITAEEVEEARQDLDELFFQQEYLGDFVTFTGAVYGPMLSSQILDTDEQIQKLLPEWPQIDPSRTAFSAIDPGADHPFAGILVVVAEKGLVCINEYLERNRTYAEHADGIKRMEHPFQIERRGYDKAAKQSAIELANHGLYVIPVEKDVIAGIQRVSTWLRNKQLWFIKRRVPQLIEQLQNYQWEENWGKDGIAKRERVKKVKDDLPDCLRYACMLYPELPAHLVESKVRLAHQVPEEARWAWERLKRIEHGEQDSGLDWSALSVSSEFGAEDYVPHAVVDGGLEDGEWRGNPLGDFYG
jgi:Terminase RNaseH-like domain